MTPRTPRLLVLSALAGFALVAGCTVPNNPPLPPPVDLDAAVLLDAGEDIEDAGGDAGGDAGKPGSACTLPGDCSSGFCTQGLCCDSPCRGACVSCAVPGKEGLCTPLVAGVAPRIAGVCPRESPRTCAFNGTCDGAGGCGQWPELTECGSPSCMGTSIIGLAACKGGVCTPSPNQDCEPFVCDQSAQGAVCPTMCRSPFDCASGLCDKGVCKSG